MLTLQQLVKPFQRQQNPVLFHGNGAEPLQHVRGFHHHSRPVLTTLDHCSRKVTVLQRVRMHLWLVYNQAWGQRTKQIEMFITLHYSKHTWSDKMLTLNADGCCGNLLWFWTKLDLHNYTQQHGENDTLNWKDPTGEQSDWLCGLLCDAAKQMHVISRLN